MKLSELREVGKKATGIKESLDVFLLLEEEEVMAVFRSLNLLLDAVEALEKIANYDWVSGGRIVQGNEDLPGDAGHFYRGYNAGIKGQFENTKAIAEAALHRLSAAGKVE